MPHSFRFLQRLEHRGACRRLSPQFSLSEALVLISLSSGLFDGKPAKMKLIAPTTCGYLYTKLFVNRHLMCVLHLYPMCVSFQTGRSAIQAMFCTEQASRPLATCVYPWEGK